MFNAATGGTMTTFTKNVTQTWQRHVFLTNANLVVTKSAVPFLVTVVGGGGGGGAPADGFGANAGGAGGFHEADVTLAVGTYGATIGGGGTSGGAVQIGGGAGSRGGVGGNTSLASAWTAGGGFGGGGGPTNGSNTAVGTGVPAPAANGGVTTRNNAAHGLATTVGNGGTQAVGPYPGSSATAGLAGAVVVEYRIA
jgi:hypothetical protein